VGISIQEFPVNSSLCRLAVFFGALSGPAIGHAAYASPTTAATACVQLRTAFDVNTKIRSNLGGNFCLANDIDLGGIANFKPIGDYAHTFTGTFDGRGHVLKNLTIVTQGADAAMFDDMSGTIKNLTLARVKVVASGENATAGALVKILQAGAVVDHVTVSGRVKHAGQFGQVGGLIGLNNQGGTVRFSRSLATVIQQGDFGSVGGLVGYNAYSGTISDSVASGPVNGLGNNITAGGLAGTAGGNIQYSHAGGNVTVSGSGLVGGLLGNCPGNVFAAYATGAVSAGSGAQGVGGLVGYLVNPATLRQTYAIGKITAGAGSTVGGLVGARGQGSKVAASYWDIDTTGRTRSHGGTGLTSAQFKGSLPAGFSTLVWASVPDAYPRLKPRSPTP
jgi:hypothetical protein